MHGPHRVASHPQSPGDLLDRHTLRPMQTTDLWPSSPLSAPSEINRKEGSISETHRGSVFRERRQTLVAINRSTGHSSRFDVTLSPKGMTIVQPSITSLMISLNF